jgi:hypothetical protein
VLTKSFKFCTKQFKFISTLLIFCLSLSSFAHVSAAGEKIALINVGSGASNIHTPDPELYKVKIVTAHFRTKSGTNRNYTLYIPEKNSILPESPFPFLVLIHGFFMTGYQHSNNAKYYAQRGFVTITPDMTKLLLGDENRTKNVCDILEQISGLIKDSKTPSSSLYGLIDPNRIGIAGNSAGGAVCLELLLEAQKTDIPIQAMCSLDGVPWDRTKKQMEKLKPVNILSLRAEPGLCNYYARMVPYLKLLKFAYNDVKINGAHHCDVENPTTLGCRCVCGASNEKNRALFQHLTYLFFRDSLSGSTLAGSPAETFIEAVKDLKKDGIAIADLNQLKPLRLAGSSTIQ